MKPLRSGDPRYIGEYRLIGFLGEGGMGQVHLGKSPEGMLVAIKTVKPELVKDQDLRRRFQREIQAVARVGGGYVAEMVDSDPQAARPWLATRFIPGVTLADQVWPRAEDGRLLDTRPLPVGAVWWLALGLIKALMAVHACEIVHRDLKPGNIMLSPYGPRVIDFGVVRGLQGSGLGESGITLPGVIVGTPDYMSPEQSLGWMVSHPSDVYSLGAVLVAVSTGIVPERDSRYRPLWEEAGLPLVPGELQSLVGSCLEPRPESRPSLNQLMSAVLHGQRPYPQARPSYWPKPTASLVDSATENIFGSLPAGVAQPTVQDRDGWERWYLPPTKSLTVPVTVKEPGRPTIRSGLDGALCAAYRPRLNGGSVLDRRPGQQRDASEYAIEGDRHLKAMRYEEAERAYRASLGLDPKNAAVWVDLGRTLCPQGRMVEAERAFGHALDISPEIIAARRNRYLAVYTMGGSMHAANLLGEELQEACLAVLERSPTSPAEYANLGDAYCTLRQCDNGAVAYQEALRLDPDNPWLTEKYEYAMRVCR
jgi:serine/threonine protein kinase